MRPGDYEPAATNRAGAAVCFAMADVGDSDDDADDSDYVSSSFSSDHDDEKKESSESSELDGKQLLAELAEEIEALGPFGENSGWWWGPKSPTDRGGPTPAQLEKKQALLEDRKRAIQAERAADPTLYREITWENPLLSTDPFVRNIFDEHVGRDRVKKVKIDWASAEFTG